VVCGHPKDFSVITNFSLARGNSTEPKKKKKINKFEKEAGSFTKCITFGLRSKNDACRNEQTVSEEGF